MATRHIILQSVIFLNHSEQELNYKYDAMTSRSSLQKMLKIDFKIAKIA